MKKKSISSLKKKLDRIFSIWIRKRDSNFQGYISCISCQSVIHWTEADASHYVSRNHNITRYDTKNVNSSCRKCNRYLSGNIPEYTLALDRKYGKKTAEKLTIKGRKLHQFTITELQELITKYTNLIKQP